MSAPDYMPRAVVRRGAGAVVVVAVVALFWAAFVGRQWRCTLMGGIPGVGVDTSRYSVSPTTVEICLKGKCHRPDPPPFRSFVPLPSLTAPPTVLVVRLLTHDGERLLMESRVQVHPKLHSPNGPRCEPHVAQASIWIDARGVAHP